MSSRNVIGSYISHQYGSSLPGTLFFSTRSKNIQCFEQNNIATSINYMRIFGREFGGNKEKFTKEYEIGDRWYPDTTEDYKLFQRERAYLKVLEPLLANNEKLANVSDENLVILIKETQFFRNHPMTVGSAKGATGIYTKRYEILYQEQLRRKDLKTKK